MEKEQLVKEILNLNITVDQTTTRDYESNIVTKYAKELSLDKDSFSYIKNVIDEHIKNNDTNPNIFTLYFVLFTASRRQFYGNLIELVQNYKHNFSLEYEIFKHIEILAQSESYIGGKIDMELITKARNLLEEFPKHEGLINNYANLVVTYFESHLDEADEPTSVNMLKDLQKKMQNLISCNPYSKYYLNLGRILILLKQYQAGEKYIKIAITKIEDGLDKQLKVSEYSNYLMKKEIIESNEKYNEHIKELDKIKVSNFKTIGLVTTLLGFILGSISIFQSTPEPKKLLFLMLGYAGICMALSGIVLFGLTLTLKDWKKKRTLIFDLGMIGVGAIIFVASLLLVAFYL